MKLRRRNCLGCVVKVGIVTVSMLFVLLLFWRSDTTFEMRHGYIQGPLFPHGFHGIFDKLSDVSGFFEKRVQKCISSVKTARITANYTINSVLDSVRFAIGHRGIIESQEVSGKALAQYVSPSVPDTEPLQIIVIPHSHNDPGWKKTYQQYFDDQTTHILTNMVEKLHQYQDMTFIWVESCFLDKWWSNQTQEMRNKFKALVDSGRLEITSGMWVAPDEASPHYFALLDQMIEGHHWIKKNLGIVPESSLNFDQFGYSATMPYLAKKAGLKNVLIKRIHRGLKELFGKQQKMNFHWRQFWDPEGKNDIFGHIDTYEWMSISDSCGPDREVCRGLDFRFMLDLPIPGSPAAETSFRSDFASSKVARNFEEFVSTLVDQFRKKTANYKYRVMMLPHGGDFRYDTVEEWDRQYKNLKVFMNYVNDNKRKYNVHMRFGTLKDYFNEVDKQTQKYGLMFPTVSGDFYTYTESSEFWVGYFTTRQFDKRLSREVLESLRAAELLTAIVLRDSNAKPLDESTKAKVLLNLESARKNLGVFQHHDAITGTSQAHVVVDYEKLLSSAFTSLQNVLSIVSEHLLIGINGRFGNKLLPVLQRTGHNTLTQRVTFRALSNATRIVLVNSLTQFRKEIVTLSVQTGNIVVVDPKGEEVNFDILPMTETSVEIRFEVNFPPVSLLVYTIKTKTDGRSLGQVVRQTVKDNFKVTGENYFCNNSLMNVTFDQDKGSPSMICYKASDFCTKVNIDWRYYKGSGGAYTMISQGLEDAAYHSRPSVKFMKGGTFCGIEASHIYFTYKIILPVTDSVVGRALRVEVLSDLSQVQGFVGDLALRVDTSIKSGNIYYVDSNAFQLMGRTFRDTLPFDGNVYPMSAMSLLEDDSMRLVVHSAQPHGVVSRTSGRIEFMLDRIATRPEMDLPEGVKDNKPTKTLLFIEFQSSSEFEHTGTTESAIPSINSIFLNDVIQHPIFKFYSLDTFDLPTNTLTLLKQPFSCDIILANVKNLLDTSSQLEGTSLTLFRRAVGCRKNLVENFCPLFESTPIQPGSLFGKSDHVTEVFLSHLKPKLQLGRYETINLDPMDLKTFWLQ